MYSSYIRENIVSLGRALVRLFDSFGRRNIYRNFRDRLRPALASRLVETSVDNEQFWEAAHKRNVHLWISGTPPKEIYERLNIRELLLCKGLSVLNVGVGEGYCEEDLARNGHFVDSLDISRSALERVSRFTAHAYLMARDLQDETYDLVIHHLVAQHMTHQALQDQLTHLVRALKCEGLIAMQFASSQSVPDRTSSDSDGSVVKSGGIFRSKNFMRSLVTICGGTIENLFEKEAWLNSDCQYMTAHIIKKSKTTETRFS